MCLIVKEGCRPEIAQEDITCWKLIKIFSKDTWEAPYMGTVHKYNEVLTACDRLEVEHWSGISEYNFIDEGFHAYSNRGIAEFVAELRHSNITVKCTIPKGAEYCLGVDNEIVATGMIIHKPKTE